MLIPLKKTALLKFKLLYLLNFTEIHFKCGHFLCQIQIFHKQKISFLQISEFSYFKQHFYAESNPVVLTHCTTARSNDRLRVWTFAFGSVDAALR